MASAYLCNQSNPLHIVDAVTGAALATKTFTGVSTDYAAAAPNGTYLAVTGAGFHVQFMDLNALTLSATYTMAANTGGLVWHTDSSKVWVLMRNQVVSITPTGTQVSSGFLSDVGAGGTPNDIVVSPDGSKLYCTGNNGVFQVDTTTLAITAVYPILGVGTFGLAVTGDGAHVYTSDDAAPGAVYRIDVASGTVTTLSTVNDHPGGICLSPDGLSLWVACSGSGGTGIPTGPAVQQIATSTFTVANTITTSWTFPLYTAIDPSGVTVWVGDIGNHNTFPVTAATLTVGTGVAVGSPGGMIAIGTPSGSTGGGITGGIRGAIGLGPLSVSAGGTVSGVGTTITGSAVLNLGPVTVAAGSTLETITATAAILVGPLALFALSGRFGPKQHPVPGYRGAWRLTLHTRTFAPATLASTIIAELADARSRQLVQAWNTPAVLTFTLDGQSQSAGLVQEILHDVVAWRWDDQTGLEQPVFRGLITQSQDQLTTEAHTVTYTAHDYAAMFTRRILTSTYTVTGRDQDQIVSDLVTSASAMKTSNGTFLSPASFLPMSLFPANPDSTLRGLSGALRNRTYYGSQNVGTAIDDLSKVVGGFDYDVRPSATDRTDSLRIFYPQQGTTRTDVALQYGSTIAAVTRSVDSSQYANYVRALGNNSSANPTPQFYSEAWTPDAHAVTPVGYGLWMLDDNSGASDTVQSSLDERVAGDLNLDALLVPSYTLAMTPDAYEWGSPNMGDTVPLIIQSGRLNVNTSVRVLGITYNIGDDGQEDVTLVVSRPAQELYKFFLKADLDTKSLARR